MKKSLLLLALAAALPRAGVCLASPPAEAGDARLEAARTHFQRGVELYKERNFDAALVEFTRAYSMAENYRVLYNLGQVHVERHDYVAALKSFRQYLEAGASDLAAARREAVEQEIAVLEGRVAKIRISSNVAGAEVLIDQTSVGTTPLQDAVMVNPGTRQITARRSGYDVEPRTVTIAGGEAQDLVLTLLPDASRSPEKQAAAPVAGPAPRSAVPDRKKRSSRAPLWIGVTTTGLLAAGAGVFGYFAVRSNQRVDRELDTFPGKPGRLEDARKELKRNALVTDVLAGAALISGGITLVIGLSSSDDAEEEAARVTVRVGAREPAIELGAQF